MQYSVSKEYLGLSVEVIIDRPLGSKHPGYHYEYPVNYGYIAGTLSPDGEELDAYVLGVNKPLDRFSGICVAVIRRLDDRDDKLIVVPEGYTISEEAILAATHFQEKWFRSELVCEPTKIST
ncbi:inorganic pyrophosphatase [Hahella sp. CCB-MM4]|uniref:inorganic diphosphatase n=1 Tax=Hahella sp. (strain CCB-MM4) TaxID=1926491 RepID=UPI000B9C6D6C|nr:inorganic diphosphatase [Hahella sp. CCB-MM4]OZG71062.1 inorganic pyrophosphatase [Hahella sp. CCB-MM4]